MSRIKTTASCANLSFEKAAATLKRMASPKLTKCHQMIKLANAIADPTISTTPKKIVRVHSPLIQKYDFNAIKQLLEIDTKYKDAQIVLVSDRSKQEGMELRPYGDFQKFLNNSLKRTYEVLGSVKDLDLERKPVQIYYGETYNKQTKSYIGKEVQEPQSIKITIPTESKSLEFYIQSLSILPDTKGLLISESHPRYQELKDTKFNLPIVGEIPFISDPNLKDEKIIALTPSYILEHAKFFPNSKPAPFRKFEHPENGESLTSDQMAKYVSERLNVPEPLMNFTPYIIDKFVENGKPVTEIIDGEEKNTSDKPHHSIELRAPDTYGITEQLLLMDIHGIHATRRKSKALSFPLARFGFQKLLDILHQGSPLLPRNRDVSHYFKTSTDMLRALFLTQTNISDNDIFTESGVFDVLSCCLQNHRFSNKRAIKDIGGFEYSDTIQGLIDAKNVSNLKPWDTVILNDFFKIKTKQDFNNFVKKLSIYQIICQFETDKSQQRINLKFHLMSNILIRLLNNFGRYYYPCLTKLALNSLDYKQVKFEVGREKSLLTINDPTLETNKFDHYIKYPIEKFSSAKDDELIFDVIAELSNVPRIGPFYTVNKIILTENESILKNAEILQRVNPEGKIVFNKISQGFNSDHAIDKIVDIGNGEGTIIFYRDLHRDDVVPTHILNKLNFINFQVSSEIDEEVLRRDLMFKLYNDIVKVNSKDNNAINLTKYERPRLYGFASKFVAALPSEFFKHPLIKKITLEEYQTAYDNRSHVREPVPETILRKNASVLEDRLDNIIMDFLKRNTQK